MLSFITALVATASLSAALPQTAKSSSKVGFPLHLHAAAQIFEHGDFQTMPDIIPHLISVSPTNRPAPMALDELPQPIVIKVPLPARSNLTYSSPPGIPSTGKIVVKPKKKTPLASVLGNNQTLDTRSLDSRQECPFPYCCPDPRFLNTQTSYPYNIIGRFSSSIGECTGTLVGPNLVLTASHCIPWINCRESVGAMEFQVDYWPGNAASPTFYGWKVAYYDNGACGDPQNLDQQALDFVIVALTEDTGLPYMGIQTYNTAWNGEDLWVQQGYALDAGGGVEPYYQGGFPVVGQQVEGPGQLLTYAACGTFGDSGSPVWSWWPDGPYIIGLMTQSQNGGVVGPAGPLITTLISQNL